ncbi:BZ3500_MvSof-1268-A1-R1_Chr1-3g02499 [Microbotryum saponariae]|uniref:BZ3500_MvSof-1268-A1-R1_Chr1-3g02499 protein n=1 Tax=Microbotryum saponariae TaxID=289078 RepID=A0A2X0KVI4_9BASI|nr:BZ3500_MvSof-1268-A1-R1_Chr1-3g02499 [Microbotryum saponariae]SCZ96408.1 BZ3501_MvSof-1269-A2-R1_Chr1-3g02102 [Microbotryum saponariae]
MTSVEVISGVDGKGTRRGTRSMLWNEELWTEEERAQVDAIWKAREG